MLLFDGCSVQSLNVLIVIIWSVNNQATPMISTYTSLNSTFTFTFASAPLSPHDTAPQSHPAHQVLHSASPLRDHCALIYHDNHPKNSLTTAHITGPLLMPTSTTVPVPRVPAYLRRSSPPDNKAFPNPQTLHGIIPPRYKSPPLQIFPPSRSICAPQVLVGIQSCTRPVTMLTSPV